MVGWVLWSSYAFASQRPIRTTLGRYGWVATRFARSDHEIGATSQRRVEEARSTRAAGEGVVVFYGIAKPVHVAMIGQARPAE